jgi:hypothetical protein
MLIYTYLYEINHTAHPNLLFDRLSGFYKVLNLQVYTQQHHIPIQIQPIKE